MGTLAKRAEEEAQAPATVTAKEAFDRILNNPKNQRVIGMSLPDGFAPERFVRLLLTAATTNEQLLKCTPVSFLRAGILSASLGLEPNDPRGDAYLVPYFNGKTRVMEVQFQLGYRGMMKLARRSGHVAGFAYAAVFGGEDPDEFDFELGSGGFLRHKPHGNDRPADLTHAWALARVDGEPEFVVLFRNKIDETMQRSQAVMAAEKAAKKGGWQARTPWHTDYEAMAIKTALRRLCNRLPLDAQSAAAVVHDANPEVPVPDVATEGLGEIDTGEFDALGFTETAPPEGVIDADSEEVGAPLEDDPERPF